MKKVPNPPIRIALVQMNAVVGDIAGNAAQIIDRMNGAAQAGADIAVFPELTVTGYPPEDLLFKKHFIQANLDAVKRIALRARGPAVTLVGFVDRDSKGRLYNAAAVITKKKVAGIYRKMCLPNYGVFDEKRYFFPGDRPLVLHTDRGTIAISICEDLWPDANPCLKALSAARPHLILNLSASPYHFRKINYREQLMKRRATGLRAWLGYCNLVGGQDELVFDGSSLVISPSGHKTAAGDHFREDTVYFDVPNGQGSPFPKAGGSKSASKDLKVTFGKSPQRHAAATSDPATPSEEEEVYRALVLGTRDYVHKNGFKKVALGLSGGIDSALVAVIATDAVGPENVIGVTMPSMFSSVETLNDARHIAAHLGILLMEMPIEGLRHRYLEAMAPAFAGTQPNEAEENLQARIRGNLLMALSNKFNYLVLTTGNKSEMATGYCTLYGDMAGGFAVIKDVPKTLVYRLSRYRNGRGGRPIPQSVIDRAPTAELRFDQKDTDSLPEYDVLDRIIEDYVENDLSAEEIIAEGLPEEIVRAVIRRIDTNEYKRRQGPVGIKIMPKAFGRDRRMPITNRFNQQVSNS